MGRTSHQLTVTHKGPLGCGPALSLSFPPVKWDNNSPACVYVLTWKVAKDQPHVSPCPGNVRGTARQAFIWNNLKWKQGTCPRAQQVLSREFLVEVMVRLQSRGRGNCQGTMVGRI